MDRKSATDRSSRFTGRSSVFSSNRAANDNSHPMKIEALRIVVKGRVQGVWYRRGARSRALELNLVGWVGNCPDGTVELHAEGERENLDQLVEWCRKGPTAAEVTGLESTLVSTEGMETFLIR